MADSPAGTARPRSRRPLVTIVALAMLGGCAGTKTSDRDLLFVDATEGEAAVAGRSTMLGLGKKAPGAWVDPRSEREFRAGRIPGAIHVPFEKIDAARDRLRGRGVLVVYGNSYNSPIAIAMSKELIARGFDDVLTLRGGLEAWTAAGNAVEKE